MNTIFGQICALLLLLNWTLLETTYILRKNIVCCVADHEMAVKGSKVTRCFRLCFSLSVLDYRRSSAACILASSLSSLFTLYTLRFLFFFSPARNNNQLDSPRTIENKGELTSGFWRVERDIVTPPTEKRFVGELFFANFVLFPSRNQSDTSA